MPSSIRKVLGELPITLDGTYERILQGIAKEKSHHAARLFQCMVAAHRPLRVEELAEIFAIDLGPTIANLMEGWRPESPEEAVLSTCSALITIIDDEVSKIVQFSHFSVKEFLTSDRLQTSNVENICQYYIHLELAHTIFARACLTIILQLGEDKDEVRFWALPLASYATRNWLLHTLFEEVELGIQDLLIYLFDPQQPHFLPWVSMQGGLGVYSTPSFEVQTEADKVTPLYCATLCDFSRLVKHLILVHAEDVNTKCGQRKSPLHAASCLGYVDSARVLLDHGADVSPPDLWDWTPLHFASEHGRLEVARLLVDHGANLNVGDKDHSTPLYLASKMGHTEIVRLLLEHGADANTRGEHDLTPFQVATMYRRDDVAELLLEHSTETG
jgi:hypothetical protein